MRDKIPFYNIVNMFFCGAVFTFLIAVLFGKNLLEMDLSDPIFSFFKDWNLIISALLLIVIYEIGFILNRASSIIIAPILEKTKIWIKQPYDKDISELSQTNQKFQSMITELVLIRTHILIYCIVGIVALFSSYSWLILFCLCFIIIFIVSGKKHNDRINKIRKSTYEEKEKNEKFNK